MAKYDIFISYRREGGYDTAKHLYDLLTRDGYKVSFDIDTLRNGDFDTSLLRRIDECKDFILIIDQHAFDRTLDPHFNSNNDWLRQELAHALKKGKNIIPIFLNGATGFPSNLPSDISSVSKKNGPEYNRYYFNDFYERLKKDFLTSRRQRTKLLVYMSGIFLLIVIAVLSVLFSANLIIRNRTNIEDTHIIESKSSSEYKENELSWFANLAENQFRDNSCIWWTSLSNNGFLTPLTNDREAVESNADSYWCSDKFSLKGKIFINGIPLFTTPTGTPSPSTITLYGCDSGASYMEIEAEDHLNDSIDPETIGESIGFKRVGNIIHDGYGHFVINYKKHNVKLIVDMNYGSGGYFPALIFSQDVE